MLKRILVPIDGTEHSWRALEYACELVSYTRGSLVVMTVLSGRMKQHIVEFGSDCLYVQMGDEVLDAAHAILSGKNIDCTYLLENDNDIAESILRAVDEQECDGIVLGSRGMGVLEGLFRNSVSSVIVENANVPVTIVK
ncbi:universal stress protein [uncultured Phascolarctobacterium sp.]|uniref:universal stress protein n=1 Tax=uncultured Phascolarctobacterium sp. TaxID=512296 RepID=UPI0025F9B6E1|nr:universal stress protein [uncultured Phascolarctobacterium sp.]